PYLLSRSPPSKSTLFPYTTLFRSRLSTASICIILTFTIIFEFIKIGSYHVLVQQHALNLKVWTNIGMNFVLDLIHSLSILERVRDRKSTRLNSSHVKISYAVFCLK